jgi:hypothetical protein
MSDAPIRYLVLSSQGKLARFIGYCLTASILGIAVFYPLDVAFLITFHNGSWWNSLHVAVYCSMGMQILLRFFTTYIDETGSERVKLRELWTNYLKTGFVLDALATFPYSVYLSPADIGLTSANVCGSEEEIVHFTAAGLRLPLLLWIRRLFYYKGSLRNSAAFKGLVTVAVFCYSCHLAGCMFVASGLRSVKDFEHQSWLGIAGFVDFEASETVNDGSIAYIETKFGLYVNALYWAFTTISTTGFGDICPVDNVSRLVAMVVITCSLYMNAAIAGHVYTILLQSGTEADRVRKVSQELDRWLSKSAIDEDNIEYLGAKECIFKYFSQLWKSDLIFDIDGSFAAFLPESRRTIAVQMYMDVIQKVPLLHEVDDNTFKHIVCSHMMYDFAMPGDILCGMGINDDNYLIILSGNGAVLGGSYEEVAVRLFACDTLNSHVLICMEPPIEPVIAIAETRTEFLYIEKESAFVIRKLFPRAIESIRQRLEKNRTYNNTAQVTEDATFSYHEMTTIASEIKSLEKMRHIPSSDLDLIQRASKKMPSFCSKLALQAVEVARGPSIHFESSMKMALKAMREMTSETDVRESFVRMPEPTKVNIDPSDHDFTGNDNLASEARSLQNENRYGPASKRWKNIVKNFMNASRFSGIERCAHIYG